MPRCVVGADMLSGAEIVSLASCVAVMRWSPGKLCVRGSRGVVVGAPPRTVGKDGLKIVLRQNGAELTALGWGMAPRAKELEAGTTIDVAYRLERDEYRGESRLQARLADFRV